jgi:hypothetical protein
VVDGRGAEQQHRGAAEDRRRDLAGRRGRQDHEDDPGHQRHRHHAGVQPAAQLGLHVVEGGLDALLELFDPLFEGLATALVRGRGRVERSHESNLTYASVGWRAANP